ncbi:hypothetical protein CEXT_364021 [Caerostris extrusa]|uniref:Uncharacterized protein n=1 Tax=Caerostris extrusa TaxID=172846 RepID=A0AAV4WNV9_CAEEX|nr:hypothetical protein CEXT_364021 [Caerostris extrusa]
MVILMDLLHVFPDNMDGPYKACKIQEWIFYEYILNAVRQQGSEISILSGNAESVQCSKLLGSSKMPCHNIRSQFGHHVIASRERSVLPEWWACLHIAQ